MTSVPSQTSSSMPPNAPSTSSPGEGAVTRKPNIPAPEKKPRNPPSAVSTLTLGVASAGALAADVRQRFLRIAELIEQHGVAAMREPHVKHLEGKL